MGLALENNMKKVYRCACGNEIPLSHRTHTTIYNEKTYKIKNVPMYKCDDCGAVIISRLDRVNIKQLIRDFEGTDQPIDFSALSKF